MTTLATVSSTSGTSWSLGGEDEVLPGSVRGIEHVLDGEASVGQVGCHFLLLPRAQLVETRTVMERSGAAHVCDAWTEAHQTFHQALLQACGNAVLMGTFDRLWTASELARRWSGTTDPGRDAAAERRALQH